jgi:hypothetical protein
VRFDDDGTERTMHRERVEPIDPAEREAETQLREAAIQTAVAAIRNLDRPRLAERTAIMDALVKARGNASEHGIRFGM